MKILIEPVSEYKECLYLMKWAKLNTSISDYIIKHVNEGKRSAIVGRYLKLIGLSSGIPDFQLPISSRNWHGLWWEMKQRGHEKKKKRPEQDEWIAKLVKVGQYATYTYGWEDAARIITDYLSNKI